MPYRTRTGPIGGPIRYGTTPDVIAVYGEPDQPMPIGVARCVGFTAAGGAALWSLTIGGYDISGYFVVVDREFRRVM